MADFSSKDMYALASVLYPLNRSITGEGLRATLRMLAERLPGMAIREVPSGTQAFDWTVPDEWTVRDAYVEDEGGRRVIDFRQHNLHLVGYSEPVDLWLERDELDRHLHSLPEQPDAIPYVTSYYRRRWGFCLTENQRRALAPGRYHAVIDGALKPGVLNYGELILPGREDREVLLSTNVCHPSLANNELSGPVVTAALARWLQTSLGDRRYTYRILFLPETIGSVVYLSRHADEMKRKTLAGFVITCVGDERTYSLLSSPRANTIADRVAAHVLRHAVGSYVGYSFRYRGSDERQYCSPLIDLPVVSVMRSKYGAYPEYHTSLDDLTLISQKGLEGAFEVLRRCLLALESNCRYRVTLRCEPQLGKRGLYRILSHEDTDTLVNLLAYADGERDLLEIAESIGADIGECAETAALLERNGLLEKMPAADCVR